MMTKLFIYFACLSFILFLPEQLWDRFWSFCRRFIQDLKHLQENNPLKKEELAGKKLLATLPDIEAKLALGLKTTAIELPQYKFYTALLFDLLQVHRKLGISLKNILPELRLNLIKDLQFEKKMMDNIAGGNLQFLVITATTWGFIFLSSSLADLPLNHFDLLIILLIQTVAIIVFNGLLSVVKKRYFLKFNQSIESLYLFVSLVEVGLPVERVLTESKILEGDFLKYKLFAQMARRLESLVNRWKESGMSPKVESAEIIAELWHLKEMGFDKFLKQVDVLKFLTLAFFFLPAYFYYLYSIFRFFMQN